MTTIFSNGIRSQLLFTYGISAPTPLTEVVMQIPCSGINPEQMYVGQTEPDLVMTLVGGKQLGLNSVDWTYTLNVNDRNAGTVVLTDGAVTFTTGANGDPIFTHSLLTGEVLTSGTFNGQFKALRNSDNFPMFFDVFTMRRYPSV